MKCPKCGYLGFETTDRCRNCQYDFSLAPFSSEPELTLHGTDRKIESPNDFDLPAIARQSDKLSSSALDLDRLFGDADPAPAPARKAAPTITVLDDEEEVFTVPLDESELPAAGDEPPAAVAMSIESEPHVAEPEPARVVTVSTDDGALPFDDGPIVPPPAARAPLAVRRSTPEVPRNRPRTTRPVRTEPFDFEPAASRTSETSEAATETVASLMELPSLGARVGAGAIDLLLLIGIDAVVLYLTLRVTGLQNSLEDLRVLPPVPFVGFLATLAFGYVAAFTVAGGQTIGKMVLSLRVIGDDGRPVDAAGGMLRALGCMLVPMTLGLSYLPALFTSDHRAIHDRLAGTRVVQE
ncbi:MAG TPA: RDD family protein [Vicinamibacterales bacterium]